MSRMIHASTWALPVNYDHLIPSLKAYTSIKPTIRTLQTAKTTQQNEKCFIRRMPQELIDHIISYLMAGELGEQDRKWAKLVECRRGRCSRHDHIRASEREDVLQEAADQHGYYVDDSESTFMEAVEEYLAFQYDESVFHDGHYKSIRKYYKYSVVEDEGHLDVTTKRNAMIVAFIEVLKTDFGLETFIEPCLITREIENMSDEEYGVAKPAWYPGDFTAKLINA